MGTTRTRTAAVITSLVLALAACTNKGEDGPTVTVTVPPSSSGGSAASSGPGSSTAGNLSATNSATPSAAATALPGTCDSTLSEYYVTQAIGGAQLAGTTAFVVGVPDKNIGRLATINCRYGVTGAGAAAKTKVEIGVSLYATAAQASTRITATVNDYTAHGGTATDVSITPAQGQPALTGQYLSGGSGEGYDLPLLVVAAGQRTVAVTVDPAAVTKPPAQQAATAIAQVALQRTGR